jgi:Flp pilus assembly protein CpaB
LLLVVVAFFFFQQSEPTPEPVEATLPADEAAQTQDSETTPEPAGTAPSLVEVVVSLQTVPRGWQMTEAELTTDLRRASEVGVNVITDIDEALGKYARTDIFQGETLTRDALIEDPTVEGVEEYGPSSLIPEGFVAQAVPMDRLSSVAYGVDNGDLVDIMLTFVIAEVDEEFTTLLQNSAVFSIETVSGGGEEGGEAQTNRSLLVLDPFGRFETLPNGDLGYISPSESQRPMRVSFVLQGAKVIQVGPWEPRDAVTLPTPTPTPDPNATPTPEAGVVPTPTPPPPDVLLLALAPQQQLVLKYAVENAADIDFALRGPEDGQIYSIENVDINAFLSRFGIEPPIDYEYTVSPVYVTVTPVAPPAASGEGGG